MLHLNNFRFLHSRRTLRSTFSFESVRPVFSDGTTDVTRTVALHGNKDAEFKRMFTLVLKGHIGTASMKFPDGVNGMFSV